jgi:hypothetical protein
MYTWCQTMKAKPLYDQPLLGNRRSHAHNRRSLGVVFCVRYELRNYKRKILLLRMSCEETAYLSGESSSCVRINRELLWLRRRNSSGTSVVTRYQRTSEDTARAVSNCRVYEIAIERELRVKRSMNPVIIQNPIYSHSYT